MYFRFDLGFGSGRPAPGCVLCPGVPRSFGFYRGDGLTDGIAAGRGFGFVRVLLGLLTAAALVWGILDGHAVECIAAVIAAVLVDVIARLLHGCKEA
ncbi:hypothetical protein ACWCPM_30025 [Streptomyces sp. NPDC002309]